MTTTQISEEEHIPIKAKIAFGSANTASSFLSGTVFGAIDTFYIKLFNVDPASIAISWILFIVWNMFNDPIIGIIQDRTHSKLGRRIPYLRYGAPIYAISFILVWYPFLEPGNPNLLWNHLLILFVFDTLYSMIGLITYSLPMEMAITTKARTNLILYSTFIGVIGTVGSILLPIVLLKGDSPDLFVLRLIMIIFGILSGVVLYLSSYFIKENQYTQQEEPLSFKDSIKETFKNKQFLVIEVAIFFMITMQNIVVGEIVFLFDYILKINNLISYLFLIPPLIVLFWTIKWINTNIEKHGLRRVLQYGSLIGASGLLILLIVGIFNNYQITLENGFIGLTPIMFGLIIILFANQPLMGEVIDLDEVRTGKRRETTYSGINALLTKPAVSLGHALFLWTIKAFGYNENLEPSLQNPSVSQGVLIAFTVFPIICLIITALSLKWYKLEGKEWQEQKKKLQLIHIQKEKEFIESLKLKKLKNTQENNKLDIEKEKS